MSAAISSSGWAVTMAQPASHRGGRLMALSGLLA
jgi:hypothetical protein